MKKIDWFCVLLSVIAAAGLGLCIIMHGEVFSAANSVCFFLAAETMIFLPLGMDRVDAEEINLLKAFILAIIGIEAGIMLQIPFWLLPLVAAIPPAIYFMIHSWYHGLPLPLRIMAENTGWLLFLSYAAFALIKLVIEPAYHYLFN